MRSDIWTFLDQLRAMCQTARNAHDKRAHWVLALPDHFKYRDWFAILERRAPKTHLDIAMRRQLDNLMESHHCIVRFSYTPLAVEIIQVGHNPQSPRDGILDLESQ